MKCNWEWLSAYLDGALADDKRVKLEEHLKTCEACTAKLEEFARVEQTAKKIPAPQLSEAYWENFASRVQNKLTIREKQRTSPRWLEALKSFFQPTAGKLAIAGSVAVIILLTFVSLDQWKKQTFRPPVFEAEKPVVEGKVDSVQLPAKDESEFRAIEQGKKTGLVDKKGPYLSAPKMAIDTLAQKPMANAPAASAPIGRMLAAPEVQESKEEPSLAAFADRDEAVKGDTVVVTAGKKAEIRKEVATSQVKVAAEEIEKLPIRNADDLLKNQADVSKEENKARIRANRQPVQGDTVTVTAGRKAEIRKFTASPQTKTAPAALTEETAKSAIHEEYIQKIQEWALIKGSIGVAEYGNKTMPAIDTAQLVSDIRQIIAQKEKDLKGDLSKSETESLYIFLAQHYVQLYRFSLEENGWKKADKRLTDFLKTDLYETNRRWLVAIQGELKKLKK